MKIAKNKKATSTLIDDYDSLLAIKVKLKEQIAEQEIQIISNYQLYTRFLRVFKTKKVEGKPSEVQSLNESLIQLFSLIFSEAGVNIVKEKKIYASLYPIISAIVSIFLANKISDKISHFIRSF